MFRFKSGRAILREIAAFRPPSAGAARSAAGHSSRKASEENEKEGWSRFRFYKSRGQHILTNPRALDAIVRKAGVLPGDTVLEIGPGTGNLTLRLLSAARRVVAIEIDPRMVDALRHRVSDQALADKLQVFSGDALKTEFPEFDLCVANIPYGISSPLVDKLLFDGDGNRRRFRSATILLQKEFARRLVAKPGVSERNRLAINVGLVATVELLMDVSKRDFVPSPKVDSSLVRIRPKPCVPELDLEEWRALTRVCFCQKRKTLGAIFKQKGIVQDLLLNSSSPANARRSEEEEEEEQEEPEEEGGVESGLQSFRQKLVSVLREGGFMEARPATLSEEDMLRLLSLFSREGIRFYRRQ